MPKLSPSSWTLVGGIPCRSPRVGPVHWFGDRLVEVVDETLQLFHQVHFGSEAAAAHDSSVDDPEDNLDLIQPGTVLGDVDKPNAMSGVQKEGSTRGHGFQNAMLFSDAQCLRINT